MAAGEKRDDRRVLRTRQLLRQGFVEVMREKGFAAMSIQDIADRVNVNRGTFYIHFTDKYMLLDQIVRENFRQLLANALPPVPSRNKRNMRLLILALLNCFDGKYQHRKPSSRFPAAQLELAIHEELTKFLIGWNEPKDEQDYGLWETKAQVMSWAILGTAVQWSQEPLKISVDQIAEAIHNVISDGT